MIEFNLIVPVTDKESVRTLEGDNFRIIQGSKMNRRDAHYFLVESDEPTMTLFVLKYGSENVWKR